MTRRVIAGVDIHVYNLTTCVSPRLQTNERHAEVLHPIPESQKIDLLFVVVGRGITEDVHTVELVPDEVFQIEEISYIRQAERQDEIPQVAPLVLQRYYNLPEGMKNLRSVFVALSLVASAVSSHAQIAQWDFETLTISSSMTNSTSLFGVPPELGPLDSSSASSVHATAATFSTQLGNGSTKSITANGWSVGDYWQFQTSTMGLTNIGVSWDQTSSGTGPRDFKLSYSLDGTSFTDWTSYSVLLNGGSPNAAWSSSTYRSAYFFSYNLSGITALNNASSVYFRLTVTSTTNTFGGTVASAGTDRVDNFTIAVVPLIPAEIVVEQPVGTNISDGGTKDFGSVAVSGNISLTFTIKNIGTAGLTGLGTTIDGSDAALFTVTANPTAPVIGPFGSTTFTVQFTPTNAGVKTAALHIANNDSNENPFDINLSGRGLSFTQDTDGDGLNDAAESQLAALGFDWQVSQPSLVSTLFVNANGAGLYTTNQVQALNVGVPLIQRNPTSGQFTLTIAVQKSTNLVEFAPFPMTAPETTINGQGNLEFQFTVPDNAAFFRLESK